MGTKTIAGVKIDKVQREILAKYCSKYGVPLTGTITTDVSLLAAKIRATVSATNLADCTVCGGDSSLDDAECPYCGSQGIEDEAPKEETASTGNLEEVVQAGNATPALSKDSVLHKLQAKSAPETSKPAPVIVTSKDKKAKGRPKKDKAEALEALKAVVQEANKAEEGSIEDEHDDVQAEESYDEDMNEPAEALATVESVPTKLSTITIESAIDGVSEAKRNAVVCHWQLGQAILRCFENDLWKQKRDSNGQPLYKGFYQFCEGELKLSSRYCYSIMDIASSFSSQDVADIGVAKLGIMVKLPEAERTRLLDDVRNGISYSQLSIEVKKLQAESGGRQSSDSRTAKATEASKKKALSSKTESAVENVITCTHDITRSRIPLFVREDNVLDSKKNQPKRAKRLADDPWGEEISSNGITIRYSLTMDANGDLVIVVERRRTE